MTIWRSIFTSGMVFLSNNIWRDMAVNKIECAYLVMYFIKLYILDQVIWTLYLTFVKKYLAQYGQNWLWIYIMIAHRVIIWHCIWPYQTIYVSGLHFNLVIYLVYMAISNHIYTYLEDTSYQVISGFKWAAMPNHIYVSSWHCFLVISDHIRPYQTLCA